MRIRILKQTSINGQPARVGQLLEPAPADARTLIEMGKAEAAPTDPDPVVVTPEAPPRLRKPRTPA